MLGTSITVADHGHQVPVQWVKVCGCNSIPKTLTVTNTQTAATWSLLYVPSKHTWAYTGLSVSDIT